MPEFIRFEKKRKYYLTGFEQSDNYNIHCNDLCIRHDKQYYKSHINNDVI